MVACFTQSTSLQLASASCLTLAAQPWRQRQVSWSRSARCEPCEAFRKWLPFDSLVALLHTYCRWLGSNLLRTASIPSTLSRLTALRKLWLPSNHLVELPEAICDLPALEWL